MIRSKGIHRKSLRPSEAGKVVGVRLPPEDLAAIDSWIDARPHPKPSRSQALRLMAMTAMQPPATEE